MMSQQLSLDLPHLREGKAASRAMGTLGSSCGKGGAQGWPAASRVRLAALPQGFICFDGAQESLQYSFSYSPACYLPLGGWEGGDPLLGFCRVLAWPEWGQQLSARNRDTNAGGLDPGVFIGPWGGCQTLLGL